jgi:hypothetical protein
MRTAPSVTSYSRDTSDVIVVLPAPEGPTSATVCPARTSKSTPSSTSGPGVASSTLAHPDSSDASELSAADR